MSVIARSLGCVVCSVGLASLSLRDPARAVVLERWSGIFLIVGLTLLGIALHGARG